MACWPCDQKCGFCEVIPNESLILGGLSADREQSVSFQSEFFKFIARGDRAAPPASEQAPRRKSTRPSANPWPAYSSDCRSQGIRSKAADGVGLGIVDAENGQQPGQLQHVVELVAQIGQVQRCALRLGADVRGH